MKDRKFLTFIHSRLELHGDSPNMDFMCKLRSIVECMSSGMETPNSPKTTNSAELEQLVFQEQNDEQLKRNEVPSPIKEARKLGMTDMLGEK